MNGSVSFPEIVYNLMIIHRILKLKHTDKILFILNPNQIKNEILKLDVFNVYMSVFICQSSASLSVCEWVSLSGPCAAAASLTHWNIEKLLFCLVNHALVWHKLWTMPWRTHGTPQLYYSWQQDSNPNREGTEH